MDDLGWGSPSTVPTHYWQTLDNGKIQCDLCPRHCHLTEGQRGLCYVRGRTHDQVVLATYGRSSGFCIDPIEKKPLNHFYPGSSILSLGTAGCNLACKFCQNWDISKSRQDDTLNDSASAEQIAQTALQHGCRSVAYTYNDPVIFHEYAIDIASACRERGLYNVAVTAAYICEEPRREFFAAMDATNVDLKGFNDQFYYKICGAHLQPILDSLRYLVHETDVWVEVTTLLIPGQNDDPQELHAMAEWMVTELGPQVPWHFTAFHPDWKMRDIPSTPAATLLQARDIARRVGMQYVYVGNVFDLQAQSTYCHHCGQCVIERDWYQLGDWQLDEGGRCQHCQTAIPGHFAAVPESWGRKRLAVHCL